MCTRRQGTHLVVVPLLVLAVDLQVPRAHHHQAVGREAFPAERDLYPDGRVVSLGVAAAASEEMPRDELVQLAVVGVVDFGERYALERVDGRVCLTGAEVDPR